MQQRRITVVRQSATSKKTRRLSGPVKYKSACAPESTFRDFASRRIIASVAAMSNLMLGGFRAQLYYSTAEVVLRIVTLRPSVWSAKSI